MLGRSTHGGTNWRVSSSAKMRRAPTLSAALLVAVACGTPTPSTYDAGPPHDAGHVLVEIGTRESGAIFTPWHDGDTIPLVRGPQGGVMLTPSVAIDGALVSGTDPSFDVVISNLTPPERVPLGEFPGVGPLRAIFARLDARLVDGPIYDQTGWTETPGVPLIVRARVTGNGIDAFGEVQIVLGASGTPAFDAGAFDGVEAGTRDADAPDAGP